MNGGGRNLKSIKQNHESLQECSAVGRSCVGHDLLVLRVMAKDGRHQPQNDIIEFSFGARTYACKHKHFRILFLDKRNQIIADEVQQKGTVDHTPVYVREVVKRALDLSATAIVLVHNHPSGDHTTPLPPPVPTSR